jgi:hypothetical protein
MLINELYIYLRAYTAAQEPIIKQEWRPLESTEQ